MLTYSFVGKTSFMCNSELFGIPHHRLKIFLPELFILTQQSTCNWHTSRSIQYMNYRLRIVFSYFNRSVRLRGCGSPDQYGILNPSLSISLATKTISSMRVWLITKPNSYLRHTSSLLKIFSQGSHYASQSPQSYYKQTTPQYFYQMSCTSLYSSQ